MLKAKAESATESQKQRKRQFESHSIPISSERRMLPIEDVPSALRGGEGKTVSELPAWLGNTDVSVIQQLKQDSREKGEAYRMSKSLQKRLKGLKTD